MSTDMTRVIKVGCGVRICLHFYTAVPINVCCSLLCIQVLSMQTCLHIVCSISKDGMGDFGVV